LQPNVLLDQQGAQLLAKCGVKVSAKEGNIVRDVNVFDSTNIRSQNDNDDPDLGAPNKFCPGGGPGKGNGGSPNGPFPNCNPQGNLLVIQDPRKNPRFANDSPFGGCILFEFERPIDLENVGLLHGEASSTITVCGLSTVCVIVCPVTLKCSLIMNIALLLSTAY
jgi:hypothetical protein